MPLTIRHKYRMMRGMTNLRDQLLTVSDAYGAARGISRSRVSTIVFNAGLALDRVASGRDLTTRKFERALQWFSDHWPQGTRWPKGVSRPAISPRSAA